MTRVIKYRGLCVRTKKWVYGYLSNNDVINTEKGRIKVIPESVGQFIGLYDKNGVEIYEGDILSCKYWDGANHIVQYNQDSRYIGYWFPKGDNGDIEAIGNIHEKEVTNG